MQGFSYFVVALLAAASVVSADIDPSAVKFLACDQEKGKLLEKVSSFKEENAKLSKSLEELQSQLAKQTGAEVSDIKEQLKQAQAEAGALKTRADAAEKHAEQTKQLHQGAQEQSDLLQAQITRLYDDLQARQGNLEAATAAHDKLAAELKVIRSDSDGSRRDLEAQLAAATKAASSEKSDIKGELEQVKMELEKARASLMEAEMAYLPKWSHSYYETARQTAEPALRYHREEIMTGRAYEKARATAQDVYIKAHTAAHPHAQKLWGVVGPTFTKAREQIMVYWDILKRELSKEPYSTYIVKAQGVLKELYNIALTLRTRAIDLWNSDEANKAKAFLVSQKQAFERDLGNIYTHALGADVPGSGIDASFVQTLVQVTLFAVPAFLLGVPLLCMRGKKKKSAAAMPTASPAGSKNSKRMRKR